MIVIYKVSLTQFINFTLKQTSQSKANYVHDIKYKSEYSPAIDYWKQLRDEIKKVHEKQLPLENLYNLLDKVHEKKKDNYNRSINQYIKFANKKDIEWFETGSSYWLFEDRLMVNSQPEIGLKINQVPFLLKIYYTGKSSNVNKNKVQSALTLMETAERNFTTPDGAISALLNLHNLKFYSSEGVDKRLLIALKAEASHFAYLYESL